MKCDAIVSPAVAILSSEDAVADALATLVQTSAGQLPVTDATGRFLGVFGLRQILGLLLPKAALLSDGLDLSFVGDDLALLGDRLGRSAGETVGAHMAAHPTIGRDTQLVEALLLLYRGDSWLPVLDKYGRLDGIVTAADALARIAEAV
jgi:CBS-domain-containing membrane protein